MDRLRSNVSPSYFFSAIYEEVSRKKRKDSKKRIRGDQSSTLIESMKQQFNQGRTQHSHSHNGFHLNFFRLLPFFSAIQLSTAARRSIWRKKPRANACQSACSNSHHIQHPCISGGPPAAHEQSTREPVSLRHGFVASLQACIRP
jgi:hypothetical protein